VTNKRPLKIVIAAAWAVTVLALLGIGLKLFHDLVLAPEQDISFRLPRSTLKGESREIKLFFANSNASELVFEKRSAELGTGIASDAKILVSELIKGPQLQDLFPTIPPETRLLNAYRLHDILVLNFTREIQTNHTGGTASEMLTVYSIINTATVNLDGIEQVQILVEGKEIETLAGHMDLSKPLPPKMKWIPASHSNAARNPHDGTRLRETGMTKVLRTLRPTTPEHVLLKLYESV
jgi:germination protein M